MKRLTLLLALLVGVTACQDNVTQPTATFDPAAFALSTTDVPGLPPHAITTSQISPAALTTMVTETGRVSGSVDGFGTVATSGTVLIDKPAGATVRRAVLAAATTGFSGGVLADGEIQIDGAPVNWDATVAGPIANNNHWAEVTALVSAKLNAAPAGLVDFTISQDRPSIAEGIVLGVIFNDPNRSEDNTVIFLFGSQSVAGDEFVVNLADPVDTSDPDLRLVMGLGISFGFQTPAVTNQVSLIDVNGERLSSSAGGQDDTQGAVANGSLMTIGGTGDSPTNPPPFAAPTDFDFDDELYDLTPFVSDGDTQIDVFTVNPSNDDNIFFAWFDVSFRAGVNEPPPPPPPPSDLCVGADVIASIDGIGSNSTDGMISLGDPTVFAATLNVEGFLPRPARASDVRFGNTWESGAPAHHIALMDLNGDGARDLLMRWFTNDLGLATGMQDVQIWGLDSMTGLLYCGFTTVNVVP